MNTSIVQLQKTTQILSSKATSITNNGIYSRTLNKNNNKKHYVYQCVIQIHMDLERLIKLII